MCMYVIMSKHLHLLFLAQEGSGPEASSPVQVVVTDDVANPLIGFDSSSLEATIDDGNVLLMMVMYY